MGENIKRIFPFQTQKKISSQLEENHKEMSDNCPRGNFEQFVFPSSYNRKRILVEFLTQDLLSVRKTRNVVGGPFDKGTAYLIFVIFFTRAKILENKIYTEKTRKLRQNTQ